MDSSNNKFQDQALNIQGIQDIQDRQVLSKKIAINQNQGINGYLSPSINRPRLSGCPCGWIWRNRKYGFHINNYFQQETTMHFKSQHFDIEVQNSIAVMKLTQIFINELEQPVEATYSFPTDPDMIVSKMQIQIGEKIVHGKVMEKQDAQEKYDDAIAGGNSAVLVQEKEKNKDLIETTIGGINPEQEVKVTLEFIKQLEIEGGAYCLRVPTSYFIKTSSEASELGMRVDQFLPGIERKVRPPSSEYTFRVNINTTQPITYLSVPNHSKVTRTDHKLPTQVEILQLEGNASLMKKDLLVYFKTLQMDRPQLLAQQSIKHKDKIACLISVCPTFVPPEPQEEIEIVENERPEELDILEMHANARKDMGKQVFIFLVDRSGSMRGKKMDMTKEALKLFISSLPPMCVFEIISFGGKFNPTSKKGEGFVNIDREVKNVKERISGFSADMGGTNIYKPLNYAINEIINDPKKQYQKKIFLLTDGEIKDPNSVIQLARDNNERCVVHTFGIGNGCSKYLVKGLAKAGRGSYSFVEEDDNLKAKVIKALKKAVEPTLQGCRFEFDQVSQTPCPVDGYIGDAFRYDFANQYFILKNSEFENFKIKFKVDKDPVNNCSIQQEYSQEDFTMLPEGETLCQLAAKMMIKQLEDNDQGDSDEIKRLSIQYQVMSEQTAFVGVVKQDDKHTGQLKKVIIPTTSSANQKNYYLQQQQYFNPLPTIYRRNMLQNTTSISSLGQTAKMANSTSLNFQTLKTSAATFVRSGTQNDKVMINSMNLKNDRMLSSRGMNESKKGGVISQLADFDSFRDKKQRNSKKTSKDVDEKLKKSSTQSTMKPRMSQLSKQTIQEDYEDFEENKGQTSFALNQKPTLENLIDAQSSAGMWTNLQSISPFIQNNISNLAKPTSEELEKLLSETLNENGKSNMSQVWLTILALWILRELYEDQEDEWSLIARKAKNYLKTQGITKVEPLFKHINLQLN